VRTWESTAIDSFFLLFLLLFIYLFFHHLERGNQVSSLKAVFSCFFFILLFNLLFF